MSHTIRIIIKQRAYALEKGSHNTHTQTHERKDKYIGTRIPKWIVTFVATRVCKKMQNTAAYSSGLNKKHMACAVCVLYITTSHTHTHTEYKQLCSNFSSEKQKHTPRIERQPTTIVAKTLAPDETIQPEQRARQPHLLTHSHTHRMLKQNVQQQEKRITHTYGTTL